MENSKEVNYFEFLKNLKGKVIDYVVAEGSDEIGFRFVEGGYLKIEFEAEAECVECYGQIKETKMTLSFCEGKAKNGLDTPCVIATCKNNGWNIDFSNGVI